MPDTKIEKATESDLSQILDLQKEAYMSEAMIYNDYNIPPLTQTLDEIKKEFQNQLFLKIVKQDTIAGSVRAFEKQGVCYIGKLIVKPDFQNQGYGSKLLKEIESRFPDVEKYELFTGDKSIKNLHLYRKNSYEIVRRQEISKSLTLLFLNKSGKSRTIKRPRAFSPLWWPLLALTSPVTGPWLFIKNRRFKQNRIKARKLNQERIDRAEQIEIPEIEYLELTVLVELKAKKGFMGDAGVSYLFKTDLGSMLFDVGFGPARPALSHNCAKLDFNLDKVDALAISHLHMDHMGGVTAQRNCRVTIPAELMPRSRSMPCFLPERAEAPGFKAKLVEKPSLLGASIASTGPLARSLFMLGYIEEQALVARIRGKGLVIFTGCGHPTIEIILKMARRICDEPLYAIGGGLHFPVTDGRGNRAGIKFQTFMGTGKPPWQRITDQDLSRTIEAINNEGPKKVLLSGHDTCDYALNRFRKELNAETEVLFAGATYKI